ncbi:flavin reductase family protein [Desulfosporosinus sp. FKB]|uniref:flavin reductase family protein n=1 Tax=Desulfosporosinus sp. FKB TaxID=1969835 RepID=UPI000B4A145E|nr:flavin reductase family protein [Desulfosporosinus sp. FKB]
MEKVKIKNYPMVNPIPIVLAGAEVNGKPNYATIGAFGVVCEGPIFYISLKDTHFTTIGVKENGYFSVNIPSVDMIQKTDYCGSVSGKTVDKSHLFSSFYDEIGKAPMISECPMNFLCKVVQTVPICGFEVFFGEIVSTFVNENCLTGDVPDPLKINPTLGMGFRYYNLGQSVGAVFKEGQVIKSK